MDANGGHLTLVGAKGRRFVIHTTQVMSTEIEEMEPSELDDDGEAKNTTSCMCFLQMVTWVRRTAALPATSVHNVKVEPAVGTTCCAVHTAELAEAGIRRGCRCRCFLDGNSLARYNAIVQEATSRLNFSKDEGKTDCDSSRLSPEESEALLLYLSALEMCDDDINLHAVCAKLAQKHGYFG